MPFAYDLYNSVSNGKLETVQEFSYFNASSIAAGSTATISTVPGTFGGLVINKSGVYNMTLMDGTNTLAVINATSAGASSLLPSPALYGAALKNGLCLTVASLSGDFTLMYR